MSEILPFGRILIEIACAIAMIVRFRGSPGAVFGGLGFGLLALNGIVRVSLSYTDIEWYEYAYLIPIASLIAYSSILAGFLTGRVHPSYAIAQLPGSDPSTFNNDQEMPFSQILFSFKGRINRARFIGVWFSVLALNIIFAVVVQVMAEREPVLAIGLNLLWLVPVVWVSLSIQAKRWHDRGKSAWMILVGFIPIIGWIWVIVELAFLKGTVGSNQYGSDSLVGKPERVPTSAASPP